MRGDALAAAGEADPVGRRRLDADAVGRDAEDRSNPLDHRGAVRDDLGPLTNNRHINMGDDPAARTDETGGVAQELVGGGAAPPRIGGREMLADVAGADRTQYRVGQRVQADIGVGMPDEALAVRNFDPADRHLVAGSLLLKRRLRQATVGALALAATGGLYELWRLAYYGAVLPTTYYVKVAGEIGARLRFAGHEFGKIALVEGLWPYVIVLLLGAAGFLYALIRRRAEFNPIRFEVFFSCLWIVYWFYIGGDHFWDRFLLILYPMGVFAVLSVLKPLMGDRRAIYALILLVLIQAGTPCFVDPRFAYSFNKYDCWIGMGEFLGKKYPGKTLAVGALGKMPYFSDLYAMDILGLADPVIAHMPAAGGVFEPGHEKYNADYTLSRRPDVIALNIYANQDLGIRFLAGKVSTGRLSSRISCGHASPSTCRRSYPGGSSRRREHPPRPDHKRIQLCDSGRRSRAPD